MLKLQANNIHLVTSLLQATSAISQLPSPTSWHPASRPPLDQVLFS